PRRRWIAVPLSLFLLVAMGMGLWSARQLLLREAANVWIISDMVSRADAVAVLGGGLETRPFAAANYYRDGLVRKVLVTGARETPSEELGITPPHTSLNIAVLKKLGVPETAIESVGIDLSNTHQEAMALRQWAERNRPSRLIVPTEEFSSRRVRWVLR